MHTQDPMVSFAENLRAWIISPFLSLVYLLS